MSESSLVLVLLGVISLSMVVLSLSALLIARELRRTLRGTDRSLQQFHQLLTRTNAASRHVEAVVRQACEAASGAMHRLTSFGEHGGNGARGEPRRHHRKR